MKNTNYDILVRKDGENNYAAFCPQLNILVKGSTHEEVELAVKRKIQEYIEKKKSENSNQEIFK